MDEMEARTLRRQAAEEIMALCPKSFASTIRMQKALGDFDKGTRALVPYLPKEKDAK